MSSRAAKLKERKKKQATFKRERRLYPTFDIVNPGDAPVEFIEAFVRAIRLFDFKRLNDGQAAVLILLRNDFRTAMQQLNKQNIVDSGLGDSALTNTINAIGQQLLSTMEPIKLKQWLPYYWPEIKLCGHTIKIIFHTMSSIKGEWGTTYFTADKPILVVNNGGYEIGWSRHAFDQMCERIAVSWPDYASINTIFQSLRFGLYDACLLTDGSRAFSVFTKCIHRSINDGYVKLVLGESEFDPEFDYYYRVGYCPFSFKGNFINTMTLLCPGFSKTPEHTVISKLPLIREKRQRLLDQAENFSLRSLSDDPSGFKLLKMFHDNGVSQVIKIPSNSPKSIKPVENTRRMLVSQLREKRQAIPRFRIVDLKGWSKVDGQLSFPVPK